MGMMNRRDFIAGGLGSALLPGACDSLQFTLWKGKRLVMIQLIGGHDGLFAFAKRGISEIENRRPQLTKEFEKECLSLPNDWAMNSRLRALHDLAVNQELLFIPGVGYENPNTSHFKAREFWDSGLLPAETNSKNRLTGWLGRAFESGKILDPSLDAPFLNLHNHRTVYDRGSKVRALAFTDPDYGNWYSPYFDDFSAQFSSGLKDYQKRLSALDFVKKGSYSGELGSQLMSAAQIIQRDLPYPVLHCVLGGFDTHGGQIERLTDLYEDFSVSLSRFAADLKRSGHWKDTLVFVYSDFGRTIDENASGGTDHGYSGLSLLAGGDLSAFSSFADISSIPDPRFINRRGELFLAHEHDFRVVLRNLSCWLVK